MDLGAILESAIGLAFVFLLMSLLVTAINELLAAAFKLRAAQLKKAVGRMLGGNPEIAKKFFDHPLIRLATQGAGRVPSYLRKSNFSEVVLDLIGSKGTLAELGSLYGEARELSTSIAEAQLPEEVKKLLSSFAASAKQDLSAFRTKLEDWFDGTMERVSGWYTREVRLISLVVGLLMAGALNADTVMISVQVMRHDTLRAQVVDQAVQYVQADTGANDAVRNAVATAITDNIVNLTDASILGWGDGVRLFVFRNGWRNPLNPLMKLLGFLLTAAAATLGAPFWFDLLGRLVHLRASGVVPGTKKGKEE